MLQSMIEKLATDSDHNYIKENQFQENLFLLLKFLNLYCTCLKAYVHESFYYPLVMWGMRSHIFTPRWNIDIWEGVKASHVSFYSTCWKTTIELANNGNNVKGWCYIRTPGSPILNWVRKNLNDLIGVLACNSNVLWRRRSHKNRVFSTEGSSS